LIELHAVTFGYPGERLFDRFHWRVRPGEAWAVIGPSGCGKSTLLMLMAGLLHPQEGAIRVDGAPIERPHPETGLILQDYGLLPWATVRQNAALGLRIRAFYGPDGTHAPRSAPDVSETAARDWLARLGIDDLRDKLPAQISGGQRQRTAIARTLALGPARLLMDEPFASLDAPTREDLQRLIVRLRRETGFAYVIVTHTIEEAAFMGERVLVLREPPHAQPLIVENPGAGGENWRADPAYTRQCEAIRAALEVGQI
jgi:NitT/TauT family transport system ATP-binding protein